MTVGLMACGSIAAVALVVALVVAGEGTDDGFEQCQHRRIEFAFVHPVGGVLEQLLGALFYVALSATDLVEVANDLVGSAAEAPGIGLQDHDDAVDR